MNCSAGTSARGLRTRQRWDGLIGWLRTGERRRAWLARALFIVVFVLLFASAGCEVLTYERTDFPNAMVGADGQDIVLDDIMEIVNDPDLDDDAKRQALHDLGLEDEDLLETFVPQS